MPAGPTYEPIATTTLTSASSSVVFSSIPQTYTDLVVVFVGKNTTANVAMTGEFDLNGDGGNNYSGTYLGDGATSGRGTNNNGGYYTTLTRSSVSTAIVHFMNYSNSTTYKTWLSRWGTRGGSDNINQTGAIVGLWRNTAAITQINFNRPAGESGSFDVGCTWTLYGIKAAQMATTYEAIATVTVGSGGAASIDFSSIPATYTDLQLLISIREETSASAVAFIKFNNTTANRSERYLQGNGSSVAAGTTTVLQFIACQPSDTANTFGNASIYIPNYASSNYKSVSSDSVSENNATGAFSRLVAGLWSDTSAINQITITTDTGDVAQYSTATLYGIKNS